MIQFGTCIAVVVGLFSHSNICKLFVAACSNIIAILNAERLPLELLPAVSNIGPINGCLA